MALGLFETSWFFELNKRQMWCFECFVSETQLLLSRPESKHRSECLPQARENIKKESTTISSQKSSWAENFDTGNQYKEPPFSFSWITVVSQKREKLSWSFCSRAPGSSETPPQTAVAVSSNLWKPKPTNLGSDAPYSECVWEGRDRDMSDTVTVASTISQPHLNRLQIQQGGGLFLLNLANLSQIETLWLLWLHDSPSVLDVLIMQR